MNVPGWLSADVSRETSEDLDRFAQLVLKWTRKINLISGKTLADIETRHIWDSAQLWPLLGPGLRVLDLGSGGGFPGIVLSILSKHQGRGKRVSLVESDIRKCVFLREAVRTIDLPATVTTARIEELQPQNADVVTARALAPLTTLLAWAVPHLTPQGRALFPKGASWKSEVAEARKNWDFDLTAHPSKTDAEAAVLMIKDIRRV